MLFAYDAETTDPRDIRSMHLFAVTPEGEQTFYVTCWGESATHADERAFDALSRVYEHFALDLLACPINN